MTKMPMTVTTGQGQVIPKLDEKLQNSTLCMSVCVSNFVGLYLVAYGTDLDEIWRMC